MKFKLPRQIVNDEINKIVSKEVRKQRVSLFVASKKTLKEIVEVSDEIKKRGLPKYLVRKKLPRRLGYGIFLHPKAKPILKGQVIAPYSGLVTLSPQNGYDDSAYIFSPLYDIYFTREEQQQLDSENRYHPRRLYALHIDALKEGNFTRFINHSNKPNILAEFFRIRPNSYGLVPAPLEVIYIAKKTILPGEQLLVCYENEDKTYWGHLKIKPVPITPKTFQLNSSLKVITH